MSPGYSQVVNLLVGQEHVITAADRQQVTSRIDPNASGADSVIKC
jgi:hypothetical protein